MSARIVALVVAIVLLSGCITQTSGCDELPTTVDVALSEEELTPPDPTVCRDRDVTLVVTSEVDGILHIHGYDAEVPATPVAAGERTELAFTASRSGQFPIELHLEGVAEGVSVGIFTVNEP